MVAAAAARDRLRAPAAGSQAAPRGSSCTIGRQHALVTFPGLEILPTIGRIGLVRTAVEFNGPVVAVVYQDGPERTAAGFNVPAATVACDPVEIVLDGPARMVVASNVQVAVTIGPADRATMIDLDDQEITIIVREDLEIRLVTDDPAIGPIIVPIEFPIAIAGIIGGAIIATASTPIGTTTGATIGTIATTGSTTIGGATITGAIRTIPTLTTGAMQPGRR